MKVIEAEQNSESKTSHSCIVKVTCDDLPEEMIGFPFQGWATVYKLIILKA